MSLPTCSNYLSNLDNHRASEVCVSVQQVRLGEEHPRYMLQSLQLLLSSEKFYQGKALVYILRLDLFYIVNQQSDINVHIFIKNIIYQPRATTTHYHDNIFMVKVDKKCSKFYMT